MQICDFESKIRKICKENNLEPNLILLVYFYEDPQFSFLLEIGEVPKDKKEQQAYACKLMLNAMVSETGKDLLFNYFGNDIDEDYKKVGSVRWNRGILVLSGPSGVECVKILANTLYKLALIGDDQLKKIEESI